MVWGVVPDVHEMGRQAVEAKSLSFGSGLTEVAVGVQLQLSKT